MRSETNLKIADLKRNKVGTQHQSMNSSKTGLANSRNWQE
jgi:hypothetical protein